MPVPCHCQHLNSYRNCLKVKQNHYFRWFLENNLVISRFVYSKSNGNLKGTMKIRTFICAILAIVCGLTGCSTIISGLYGIKKIKTVDEKTIVHYSEKYNIPLSDNYELDSSYIGFLNSIDTTRYKAQRQNHYQPLQMLYYDNTGVLKSFQINCYAGGFPNLHWDRNGLLAAFPPKSQAPVDSILSFETQITFLRLLSQSKEFSADSCDFFVVVYWNRFMGRQSKRMIRFVQDNIKLATPKKVKVIYVNNDNFFSRH